MKLLRFPDDYYPLEKRVVFGAFFDEIVRQARICGISLPKFVWLYIKYSFRALQEFRYGEHYLRYRVETSATVLQELSYALNLAQSFSPIRTVRFSVSQSASLLSLLLTYTKDPRLQDPEYVSLTEMQSKVDRYARFGRSIIYDKGDRSFFRRPAYYVVRNPSEDLVIIRGSCNAGDGFTDLDYTQEMHEGYYFHGGFWAAGSLLFNELISLKRGDVNRLFEGDFASDTILTKERAITIYGHSMGASIAVVACFMLRKAGFYARCVTCGMSCVADFNFYQHSKEFCVSVVNGFDFVPTISYHAEVVYLLRTVLREMKFLKDDSVGFVVDPDEFDSQTIMQAISDEAGERRIFYQAIEECARRYKAIPPTRILSYLLTREKDLFIAGRQYQFIKGKLIAVSVHDFSDIYFTIQSLLDHQSYIWVSEQLAKQGFREVNMEPRSLLEMEQP